MEQIFIIIALIAVISTFSYTAIIAE